MGRVALITGTSMYDKVGVDKDVIRELADKAISISTPNTMAASEGTGLGHDFQTTLIHTLQSRWDRKPTISFGRRSPAPGVPLV
ncbi:hypothetical protein RB195_026053 [Necator americanus]|uniref:Uncharacterized protein n=1 Tax=Necator americanus TaxID=51031 RepID=A0ABR1EX99_NECAM